jgi:glutamyl-tRNA synthetase
MAPSPTGEYHIGSMRTLLYNYAFAKKNGGEFILRIEDTDRERFVEGATERLIQVIKDYGLNWDEGPDNGGPHAPYVQSERLELYKKQAEELVRKGNAYYCFCSKERLDSLREEQRNKGYPSTKYDKHCLALTGDEVQKNLKSGKPYVIRLNVPADQEVSFEDIVLGNIKFSTNDIDDQVLLKSDGYPTYHLAVVVDDHEMEINYIMRGVEWLPSTPKHILLYNALGWDIPAYAHLPLLKEKGGTKKLSKRMGSIAAVDFLSEGYLPEALLNFLMFLGWNPGTEKELYTLEEFINDFSIERIQKTDLVSFDREKLFWYNGQYIRGTDVKVLWSRIKEWIQKYGENPGYEMEDDYSTKVLTLVQDRMRVLADFIPLTGYFYHEVTPDESILTSFAESSTRASEILKVFENEYGNLTDEKWVSSDLDKASHELIAGAGYKPKEAFMTLRVALTGETATPPIFDILALLGKQKSLSRIRYSIKLLEARS